MAIHELDTEGIRDEAVAYVTTTWASGGTAELHVWPGAFHGFDLMAPHAVLSRAMSATRTAWVARLLTGTDTQVT